MIDYSIVKNEDTNSVAVRSVVKSFGLDHVTDKDIVTFYSALSDYAQIDTGLLPLDGTGLLAYRQAADYSQIVIQHAPGVYRIMWGENEGDRNAKHYFLAQPYRIVIGDLHNGSLLGARMFYSPVPITSPSNQLYHVNLPNINCRGYRGNGVGWVCLYHNEDWSNIPLSEKVARLMERCSGAEAYNDANMSETDGPRFYASHYKKTEFNYLWNPQEWEKKSQEGYAWTLDSDTPWIPVLVQDRDNQDKHYQDGIPLTIGMALTGDYQAYYTDSVKNKPINALTRSDRNYSPDSVFQIIKLAYAKASATDNKSQDIDPYTATITVRSEYTKTSNPNKVNDDDDDDDTFYCNYCNDTFPTSDYEIFYDHKGDSYCESCINEHFAWVSSEESYYHFDDCVYIESDDVYVPEDKNDLYTQCENCNAAYLNVEGKYFTATFTDSDGSEIHACISCDSSDLSAYKCSGCDDFVYIPSGNFVTFKAFTSPPFSSNNLDDSTFEPTDHYFHYSCASNKTVCPCGFIRDSNIVDHDQAGEWQQVSINTVLQADDNGSCCASCAHYDPEEHKVYWASNNDYIESSEGKKNLEAMRQWNATQALLVEMNSVTKKITKVVKNNKIIKGGNVNDIF